MSAAETPTTDVEEIKAELAKISGRLDQLFDTVASYPPAINGIGENVQWLVTNTAGIFQMFSNPAFISQMTNQLMGQVTNGGQPADPGAAESTGEVAGAIGG